MNYPLLSEYVESIRSAEDNLAELSHLHPVLDANGDPVMTGGNFAVVFKMQDKNTGKYYALKCFTREQEGRAESYRMIAEELEFVNTTYFTHFKYYDKELFVDCANSDETEFPVVLMDWVEGQTLDKYIREHIADEYELSMLAYQFSRLAMWLMPQPFAHGDLKPDNILVQDDGTLVLVDYDGMYVPAMKGQKARELGSPDFRHPSRTEDNFDEHIDDFSLISILLSIKAISLQPELLEHYGASDRLLFSEKDYRDISQSTLLKEIYPPNDSELSILLSLFTLALEKENLKNVSFNLLNLCRPKTHGNVRFIRNINNIVTPQKGLLSFFQGKENVSHIIDEKGKESWNTQHVSLRDEANRLCASEYAIFENAPQHIFILFDKNGKEVGRFYICKSIQGQSYEQFDDQMNDLVVFESWNPQKMQWVPCIDKNDNKVLNDDKQSTIVSKEDLANAWTDEFGVMYSSDCKKLLCANNNLTSYSIKEGTIVVCDESFCRDFGNKSLKRVIIPSSVISIGFGAFRDCEALEQMSLPNSLKVIGEKAFSGCKALIEVNIPNSVSQIGDYAFYECESLTTINIPNSISEIGYSVFSECPFSHISIPSTVRKIGDFAFYRCKNLEEVIIPDSVNQLGAGAFGRCSSLKQVIIPDSITELGYEVFSGSALSHIDIPMSVKKIGNRAFWDSNLTQLIIPNSVKEIEGGAFWGSCLEQVFLPNSIKAIADSTFCDCFALKQVFIPDSIICIGALAFSGCESLTKIDLPNSISHIGNGAFQYCHSLVQITIPDSVSEMGDNVFNNCNSLTSITFEGVVSNIGDDLFYGSNSLEQIVVPKGTMNVFEILLPNYKDKLLEEYTNS